MQAERSAGAAQVGEVFIDKERRWVVIESALPADEMFYLIDPGWVIDKALEGIASLVNLLQIQAIVIAITVAVNIASPLARFQRQNSVNPGVEGCYLLLAESLLD